eukprot:scaffold7442_cov101-Isochrysis_galbana.AAC.3
MVDPFSPHNGFSASIPPPTSMQGAYERRWVMMAEKLGQSGARSASLPWRRTHGDGSRPTTTQHCAGATSPTTHHPCQGC